MLENDGNGDPGSGDGVTKVTMGVGVARVSGTLRPLPHAIFTYTPPGQ